MKQQLKFLCSIAIIGSLSVGCKKENVSPVNQPDTAVKTSGKGGGGSRGNSPNRGGNNKGGNKPQKKYTKQQSEKLKADNLKERARLNANQQDAQRKMNTINRTIKNLRDAIARIDRDLRENRGDSQDGARAFLEKRELQRGIAREQADKEDLQEEIDASEAEQERLQEEYKSYDNIEE